VVLASCSNSPGHTQTAGSSFDKETKIQCPPYHPHYPPTFQQNNSNLNNKTTHSSLLEKETLLNTSTNPSIHTSTDSSLIVDPLLFAQQKEFEKQKEKLHATRLPLPDLLSYVPMLLEDSFEREPRFVNPKQYNRILKRRQQRAKYLQNHVILKQAAPYKHQSRHEHAQRRQRGQGGRFVKLKKCELSEEQQQQQHLHSSDLSLTRSFSSELSLATPMSDFPDFSNEHYLAEIFSTGVAA